MKKYSKIMFFSLVLALLAGCKVVSIHALWTKDTRSFDQGLIGEWEGSDSTIISFESNSDTSYKMTIIYKADSTDSEKKNEEATLDFGFLVPEGTLAVEVDRLTFEVNLVKLGEHVFLDLFPYSKENAEDFVFMATELNYLPVHTFAKIEIQKDRFDLYFLDNDHLEELFEKNRIRLPHEIEGDFTIITASTEELQKFMEKYANDQKAFYDEGTFIKK